MSGWPAYLAAEARETIVLARDIAERPMSEWEDWELETMLNMFALREEHVEAA